MFRMLDAFKTVPKNVIFPVDSPLRKLNVTLDACCRELLQFFPYNFVEGKLKPHLDYLG